MQWKRVSHIGCIAAILAIWTVMAGMEARQPDWAPVSSITFYRTYGGSEGDDGHAVVQTRDGGYIVAGYTWSYGEGESDVWLVKTDVHGAVQWHQAIGGGSGDVAYSVRQTHDGGYITAGYTRSYGAGESDVWLVKTDEEGVFQWDRTFGGDDHDMGYSVQQTQDGGYIVAGVTRSQGTGYPLGLLVKTDEYGTLEWEARYGGPGMKIVRSVLQTADRGFVVAGECRLSEGTNPDVMLMKTDEHGNPQWESTFGGPDTEAAYCVRQTAEGGYVIAGVTLSYSAGGSDAWIIKTDGSGSLLWERTLGGPGIQVAYSVDAAIDGGYIVAGIASPSGSAETDVLLVKTDGAGNVQWEKTFSGATVAVASSVQQTSDGGYIVAGEADRPGSSNPDVLLVKTDEFGNAPSGTQR